MPRARILMLKSQVLRRLAGTKKRGLRKLRKFWGIPAAQLEKTGVTPTLGQTKYLRFRHTWSNKNCETPPTWSNKNCGAPSRLGLTKTWSSENFGAPPRLGELRIRAPPRLGRTKTVGVDPDFGQTNSFGPPPGLGQTKSLGLRPDLIKLRFWGFAPTWSN